ncbi:MAG: permease [Bryobacterales bacterium]|nr:permease [Bryobacterales bacterium]
MSWISRIWAFRHRDQLASEIDEELQYHLSRMEELKAREGMPREDARMAARRHFGNATLLKETIREIDVFTFCETVARDIRFAARMLAKHAGFTAMAVLALAVGIGVNTAVFTAYKAVLLQPLDGKNPGQLVNVFRTTSEDRYQQTFSYPDYEAYRDQNHVFSGVIATTGNEVALTGVESFVGSESSLGGGAAGAFGFRFPTVLHGGAEFVMAIIVSENYFQVLGTNAIRGRVFLPQDAHDLDAYPAVMISENYWQRRFHGDASILGRTVKLNGAAFTIIGITPHDFMGTNINVPEFWIPMRLRPLISGGAGTLHDRENNCCALFARLAPGISLPEAQAEMSLLADHLRTLHAPHSEGRKPLTISITPGSHLRPVNLSHDPGVVFAIFLIMGAVGLVLLIACANVASLQLARSAARQREMGVRLSLGASRLRIVRQLLTESALLGLLAGAVSMLMTWWTLRLLMVQIAASLPLEWGSLAVHVEPDLHVFAYVFGISLLAGILFGLAPALESSRPNLSSALKEEGGRFGLPLGNARLRDLMVGTQVAACLFLIIGASLLIRGSMRSLTVSPGYETKRVVGLDLNFPAGFGYTHAKTLAEARQFRDRIQSLPGVTSVAIGRPPNGGGLRTAAVGLNGSKPSTDKTARTLYYNYVTPGYLETLGIPLVLGRGFAADGSAAEATAILSESAAEELWPGKDPIGRTVVLDGTNQFHQRAELFPKGLSYQVIAVAGNTRASVPGGDDSRKVYLPLRADHLDEYPLLVRAEGDPKQLINALSKQVQQVDANVVVYCETLEDLLTSTPTFVVSRLAAIFASIIGGLGLVLACVGIYGTVSYAVVRRTREVGIRMALGASKGDVLRLVLRESSGPVGVGLVVGILAAVAAGRVLRALLFGMSPLDPVSFAGVGALFLLIAMLAAYLPARRATHVDPMVALRYE